MPSFCILESSIPRSEVQWAALFPKTMTWKVFSKSTTLAIRFSKIETIFCHENEENESLKSSWLAGWKSCTNDLLRAKTEQVDVSVADRILWTPVWLTSVLLCFKCKIGYWLPCSNKISNLVRFVF